MKREFGLVGVIATVVGYVIGASIFILPGQLAGTVGPAVVIAYSLAAVIALFACVAAAQIGSLYPQPGAGFIAITRLVSPLGGFLTIWLMLAAYVFAIALIAVGFGEYLSVLLPMINKTAAAYGVVLLFGLLNLGGADVLVRVQTFIVLLFMIALAAVSFGGVFNTEAANLSPMVPTGWNSVILAVVPAFFSYGGFMVVMEMAGEIKNPARIIPLGLAVSFGVVLLTYIALSFTLVGTINWQTLAEIEAPVSHLAKILFGDIGATFVTVAAVGAAATSVNALILVASRDIIALSEAGLASSRLLPENSATGRPTLAVIVVIILSVISLLLGQTVMEYAVWVSAITLIYQAIIGVALLFVFAKARDEYQRSAFKISKNWLRFWGWGSIIISLSFLFLVFQDSQGRTMGAAIYLGLGVIYYLLQTKKSRN
tara:strand:+ start:151174 stop:152457 length:1284 start_codon:yes stop_codon:yes gene_type:complete